MENREYKSSVFSLLMENKVYALDVYNMLNGTHYQNSDSVEIRKLEGKVFLSVENDASFLFDSFCNMYEHQSTYNPNMPIRFVVYFAGLIWDYLHEKKYDIYGRNLIPIPTPKFVVFYNGAENRPDKEEYRLSDAFIHKESRYDLELTCMVYNINANHNLQFQNRGYVMAGYTKFVDAVRTYEKNMILTHAISRAIDDCINEGILTEFFEGKREEIMEAMSWDFFYQRHLECLEQESIEKGMAKGLEQGMAQGLEKGMAQGLEQGMAQGLEKGMAQGMERGVAQGVAQVVETIERLKSGEKPESIIESGIEASIVEQAKRCL